MAIRAYYRMGAFSILSHYALLRSLRLRCPHTVISPDGSYKKDIHYKKNTIFKFHSLKYGGIATSCVSGREAGEHRRKRRGIAFAL